MRGVFIGALMMISQIVAAFSSSDVWYCGDLPGGATPGLELAERSIRNLMANTDTNKDSLISREEAKLAKVNASVFDMIARGDEYISEDDLYVHFGCISNEVIVEPHSPSTPHTNKHG